MRAAIRRWRERRHLKRKYQAAVVALMVERERYAKRWSRDLGWFDKHLLDSDVTDAEKRLTAAREAWDKARGRR